MYTVLLVDDEEKILEVMKVRIGWQELGVDKLLTASDGQAALEYFEQQRIDLLVMKSLRAKVAAYLLSEAARAHSLTFSIPFSRIQLADYLNCDRSALSRELSTMQKEGLIDTYRSSFKLLEPDALQQMVQ